MYLIVQFGCYIMLMNLILTSVANLLIIINFVYIFVCACVCVRACKRECVHVLVLHMYIYTYSFLFVSLLQLMFISYVNSISRTLCCTDI